MPALALEDGELWYEAEGLDGRAGAAPVLLVMGLGMPGQAWRAQLQGLSPHHPVATYDHRGIGRSSPVRGLSSMQGMAKDAVRLLDHLGWERVHLVGVSMGGMVSQELALRFRDRVRSLTLIATHSGGRLSALPSAQGLALFARLTLTRRSRAETLARLLFPPEYLDQLGSQGQGELLSSDLGASTRRARLAQLAAVIRHDTQRRLGALAGLPTLIVRPGRDLLIPPQASDRLAALIPGARLVRYDDAGHGLIRQCAERLNADLLAHFAGA